MSSLFLMIDTKFHCFSYLTPFSGLLLCYLYAIYLLNISMTVCHTCCQRFIGWQHAQSVLCELLFSQIMCTKNTPNATSENQNCNKIPRGCMPIESPSGHALHATGHLYINFNHKNLTQSDCDLNSCRKQ